MTGLRLDDCDHCAGLTQLSGFTRETAIAALENGELGCWLCVEDQGDDGHTACVALYDGEILVWDGRHE